MTFEVAVERAGQYVQITYCGMFDLAGIAEAGGAFVKLPGYEPQMSALWDLRGAELLDFGPAQMQELAALLNAAPDRLGAKIAIVVSRDVDYGIMRMWQVYGEDAPQLRAVFRDMEEAQAWLRT